MAQPLSQRPHHVGGRNDLHDLTAGGAVPTNGVQDAYFSWLASMLVAAVSVLAVALAAAPRRSLAWLLVVASVVGLLVTMLALKGPLSWGDFLEQAKNMRIGGYLIIVGFIGTLVLAPPVSGPAGSCRTKKLAARAARRTKWSGRAARSRAFRVQPRSPGRGPRH